MTALLMLVPMSLVLLLLAVWLFRWAVRRGQFENLDAAAIDILRDDSADRAPASADRSPAPHDASPTAAGSGQGTDRDAD